MNIFPSVPTQNLQPNETILAALRTVITVTREIESLVPQALQQGSAPVAEVCIRSWQGALRSAATQLSQIPAPLIFPPPPFVTFANGAAQQINQALAILDSIPVVATLIFPPQPGQGSISLQNLQLLLNSLREATALLFRALQSV